MDRVTAAMREITRADFLPPDQRRYAAADVPLDIGYGVTNSQPSTVHAMLTLLRVEPGQRVLDVGAGSGWTTGLLARLAGPEGSVVGVERIPELIAETRARLGDRFPTARLCGAESGVLGWPALAPYDRILVSADARRMPGALIGQLAVGGVMVVPVGGVMHRVIRTEAQPVVEQHGRYLFVPLLDD